MDVFALRDQLIHDYATYIESFISIRDDRIREHVKHELDEGFLWPDPLLQLNRNFEPGPWIDDLVDDGTLHPLCRHIFRIKPTDESGKPLRLHRHHAKAVAAAKSGESYVLTTGTGSGKSVAYIIPIVDHVLRRGSGRGIQAIVHFHPSTTLPSIWLSLFPASSSSRTPPATCNPSLRTAATTVRPFAGTRGAVSCCAANWTRPTFTSTASSATTSTTSWRRSPSSSERTRRPTESIVPSASS